MSGTWRRWTPAIVAVVVVGGVAVAVPAVAESSVQLPAKSAAQVLALMQGNKVTAFSGDITETSDLGLPSIPASAGGSGSSSSSLASDLSLLTGTNSLRVYVDGAKNVRVQTLESLGERDVIRNGSNVWTYDSKANTVEHATIAAKSSRSAQSPKSSNPNEHWAHPGVIKQGDNLGTSTPQGVASQLVANLKSTSTLTVLDNNPRIAGRSVYELVLTPKSGGSLIGSISIAVDSATGLPLQVQADAAGQSTPAVSIGFTSVTLTKPAASLFEFTAPKGATVTQVATPSPSSSRSGGDATNAAKPTETVTGTGWDSVITVSAKGSGAGSLAKLSSSPEFTELTTAVSGGRVLHTTLFNVLFASDGRIVAGAVPVARLQAVAAQ